ncbi:hypothetical protein B0T26DRAFT_743048 [Lasiosphaeria miniovina]|uniref:WW domain-containing protein n=1 Tax=Lasiosphaeria miniovina TaxID=1954250 RepID=A0AA40A5K5_9PEZI|nr:uncharacterized protein B0T26DRAFT_743048 [Lasiosphaeria miniovina]KAK0709682.1 hypothetical protein B0T26DRAFT_743048 [Lasiosphaeria miniovina]
MADQFLVERHSWTLAQNALANEEDSWVMLTRDGEIVPIPGEKILHTSRTRVGLEISTPRELQVTEPFGVKSDSGIVYITNERVIYLPARPTDDFKSFFAPVLNFSDTHVQSSWIGPWSWGGVVRPVPGGGIPMNIPRIEVRFIFRDGGHSDFQGKFEWLKERLHHAQELGIIPGQNVEPPPPYDSVSPSGPGPSSGGSAPSPGPTPASAPAANAGSAGQHQPPQPTPNEPPPDYVEAQTQAIAMQYEQRMRDEAERD